MLEPRTEQNAEDDPAPPAAAGEESTPTAEESATEVAESLEQYLREISRWELLTPEAERALAKRTSKGDPRALEELVQRNLRLVIYWAKRYRSAGLPLQDLIQEGNIGLMRAAEKFDPRKGTRFSTYASWWIRQALARAICDKQDLIRIPVHMHQKLRRVERMLERARSKKNLGEIDVERRVNASGIVAYKEWEAARRLQQPISLDRRADPEREGPIEVEDINAISPLSAIYQGEMKEYVEHLLQQIPVRHGTVIRLRFGMEDGTEHTLESIGRRLKISRERVRQIQSEAIERISRIAGQQDPVLRPEAAPGVGMPALIAAPPPSNGSVAPRSRSRSRRRRGSARQRARS